MGRPRYELQTWYADVVMTRITDIRSHFALVMEHVIGMRNDLQSESSRWLFKSLLAGRGKKWRPQCKTNSLIHHYLLFFF